MNTFCHILLLVMLAACRTKLHKHVGASPAPSDWQLPEPGVEQTRLHKQPQTSNVRPAPTHILRHKRKYWYNARYIPQWWLNTHLKPAVYVTHWELWRVMMRWRLQCGVRIADSFCHMFVMKKVHCIPFGVIVRAIIGPGWVI